MDEYKELISALRRLSRNKTAIVRVGTRILKDAADALERAQRAERNDPLTLEELLRMDGEPVWVADLLIPKCSCYHFVQKIGDHVLLIEPRYYPAEDVMIPHYCANDENQGYGRTWLAYRRKPEAGIK